MNEYLVVLKFIGDFQQGFQVMLEIGGEGDRPSIELLGALPPHPELVDHLVQWRQLYRSLSVSNLSSRIQPQEIIYGGSVNRLEDCRKSAAKLQHLMLQWLDSPSFRRLDQRLREALCLSASIRLLIRTPDPHLRHLPWHLWSFIEHYSKTEMALSAPMSERVKVENISADRQVRILAILGNSLNIDVQADAQFLEALPNANVTFLVEPPRQLINQQLWERPWNILFFAGHSATEGDRGLIYINPQEKLSLEELKYGLNQAINQGLQLAIFNSCDGLGLAQALEPLHLPQMIVMREPVPDRVAQEFLKYTLLAFSGGKPLYLSVREARERLQGLEDQFPCATWLPIICQNSAEVPPTWQEMVDGVAPPIVKQVVDSVGDRRQPVIPNVVQFLVRWIYNKRFIFLVSLVVSIGLIGIHSSDWIQAAELSVYDQMMQQRPGEEPDSRLLIVEVTDADIQVQRKNGESLQRRSQSAQSFNQSVEISLSDSFLDRLLGVLEPYQPRVIGLDIYRDFSAETDQPSLANRLKQTSELITVCKAEDFESLNIPSIDPPPEIPLSRVGFSDFREDADGILRRHLLGMLPLLRTQVSRCNVDRAFSVQVAAEYLSQQQIPIQFTANGNLQLGDREIQILRSGSGYQPDPSGGSETLVNYRASEVATRVTLQQLLNNQVNPEYIKDKIILVGVIAQGGIDDWFIPSNPKVATPGLIVQAHMISQLLSAVLDQRPIIMILPPWQAFIWVWVWAMLGSSLAAWQGRRKNTGRSSWYLQSSALLYLTVRIMTATALLYSLCFIGLLKGIWMPSSLALLALVLCSSIGILYGIYRSLRRSIFLSQ
jgi:CHASE2 domain-containing sensor protein